MYAAVTILMAHALTPHDHVTQVSKTNVSQHEEANSLLDYLVIGFHHEQYDGQLETYLAGNFQDVSLDFQAVLPAVPSIHFEYDIVLASQQKIPTKAQRFTSDSALNTHCLRGPPAILS